MRGMDPITNDADLLDSREIMDRIRSLEDDRDNEIITDEETAELAGLVALQEEAEGYADDWQHGVTLIRGTYFTEYCQELVEDVGDLPRDLPSYLVIDWDATANNLKMDYTEVDFGGVSYYVR